MNGEQTRELNSSEPAAVPIKCNIHPWERAYLFVLDHSYLGISDKKGNLVLRGLPAGGEVPLRFFHEHGRIHSVRTGAQLLRIARSRGRHGPPSRRRP